MTCSMVCAGHWASGRPVALRLAAEPAMPMTWGTFAPRILLPAEAAGWTDERRRIVLLHELAHVARADSFARSAAAIICALYWLHPAIWYAARRMRLEQEHACDDLVLSLGAKASVYARNLLDVAGTFQPPAIVAGPFGGDGAHLRAGAAADGDRPARPPAARGRALRLRLRRRRAGSDLARRNRRPGRHAAARAGPQPRCRPARSPTPAPVSAIAAPGAPAPVHAPRPAGRAGSADARRGARSRRL